MPVTREIQVEGHQLVALPLNPDAPGQPIFLIHGITGSVYSWADLPPALLEQGPCYSLSLPGHYPAAFPAGFGPKSLTAEMIARVLTAAVRQLAGDRPVTLVGHSTGGFAALAMAAHAPSIAWRVVSVAGFARGRWTGALGLYQKLVRGGAIGRAVYKALYRIAGLSPAVLRAVMRIYVADAQAFYAYPGLAAMIESAYPAYKRLDLDAMCHYFGRMPDIDIGHVLPRITALTLALTGDRDPIVPPAQARFIARTVPNAELALITGAGHLPFVERPGEYDREVTSWLRKTS